MATTQGLPGKEYSHGRAAHGRPDRGGRKYLEIKDKGKGLHLRGAKISIFKSSQWEENVFKIVLEVLLV